MRRRKEIDIPTNYNLNPLTQARAHSYTLLKGTCAFAHTNAARH